MMATATVKRPEFAEMPYGQCAREAKGLAQYFTLVLDPEMPTDRIRYIGPVYCHAGGVHTCVPVDAQIGDRVIAADVWDSGTRMELYEITELDGEIGEEQAPWHPPQPTRKSIVRRVYVARSHSDRLNGVRPHARNEEFYSAD